MNLNRQVISEIRAALSGADSRAEKTRRIAELIRRAGDYRWVGIYVVEVEEIAAIAWTGKEAPAYPRFPVGKGLCGAAVASRATVVVGDVTKDPRYLSTFGDTGSEIIVPVLRPPTGVVLGLIDVESARRDAFSAEDCTLLEECASALLPFFEEEIRNGV